MKIHLLAYLFSTLILSFATSCTETRSGQANKALAGPITLVIHGGAGTIRKENMTKAREEAYHQKLKEALDSGYSVLEKGGKSVDAVLAAIKVMENSPLFNAGKGSVFTNEGKNEMDAAIMDGSNLMAGAVAGVAVIKNPIMAAHAVMTRSEHVMLVGAGAEKFSAEQGLEIVEPGYFFDSTRYQQWMRTKKKGQGFNNDPLHNDPHSGERKFGTVGCVALDQYGNIAAGTSTGGMTNKKYGRVGDAPVIGAGTYANNKTCGVSATGWGEYFIRLAVAYDISAHMEYAGLSLEQAATKVIMKKVPELGGDGGVVALDRQGNVSMKFNTSGMYRGFRKKGQEAQTFIFGNE